MWARVQDQLERYLEVEDLLAQGDAAAFRLPEGLERRVSSFEEVEETAVRLRQAWGYGLDPITNLVEALEERGIRIVLVEVDQKFDACQALANAGIPAIVVNSKHPGDRQRLSISHELGHLVLEPAGTLDREKAASRFAGAFLVPAQVVRKELGERRQHISLYELHLLKHKYGISMQAWLYRAMELGILPKPAAERYFREFNHRGWRITEPGDQLAIPVSRGRVKMILLNPALAESP
ncbi:MAG: ImmA/IrrE family metallo-endopeptidase [Clostridia bacterium]|nr:ImmA/IrrE family metallo-endopeptidase [Clostridia bacterium]